MGNTAAIDVRRWSRKIRVKICERVIGFGGRSGGNSGERGDAVKPLITALVDTYNHEKYVEQAV